MSSRMFSNVSQPKKVSLLFCDVLIEGVLFIWGYVRICIVWAQKTPIVWLKNSNPKIFQNIFPLGTRCIDWLKRNDPPTHPLPKSSGSITDPYLPIPEGAAVEEAFSSVPYA